MYLGAPQRGGKCVKKGKEGAVLEPRGDLAYTREERAALFLAFEGVCREGCRFVDRSSFFARARQSAVYSEGSLESMPWSLISPCLRTRLLF